MLLGWRRQVAKLQNPETQAPTSPAVAPAHGAPTVPTLEAEARRHQVTLVPGKHLTDVPGFQAQGVWAQIKKKSKDVCLVVGPPGTTGAAVFTQNAFAAAPVLVSREHVKDGNVRAIVCNAGNANACTGDQGMKDARQMAQAAAKALGVKPAQVVVCSTGIIGRPMPMEKVLSGIAQCAATLADAVGGEAAEAITTTDSHPKHAFVRIVVPASGSDTATGVRISRKAGKSKGAAATNGHALAIGTRVFHVAGIAKGAGMIHPNMATMLSFAVTDAPISGKDLDAQLRLAADSTFNMITIDGDQSTNDTCAVLASATEGGPALKPGTPEMAAFQDGLRTVLRELARMIAGDGEGATSLLEVKVEGAASLADARSVARSVAKSNLVKSALHGKDPNWGRIVAAVGSCGAKVEPGRVNLRFESSAGSVPVLESGEPLPGVLQDAAAVLRPREVRIRIHLGLGSHEAEAWGCDLSEEYVTFNSAYST